jgi:GTP-binding protein EngB required for normal cell division
MSRRDLTIKSHLNLESRLSLEKALTVEQEKFVEQETQLLVDVEDDLKSLRASKDDIDLVRFTRKSLNDMFMLVVLGEFNSGKSGMYTHRHKGKERQGIFHLILFFKTGFLNTLLGSKYLEEGVTPTTSHINVVSHGSSVRVHEASDGLTHVHVPVEWLKEVHLVDTPGTNAIVREHEKLTEDFVPRCDYVLFVTSSDRPFSESERQFLERIRQWKKKVIVVISKKDIVDSDEKRQQIYSFVRNSMRNLLHITPPIFMVSSKIAQAVQSAARGDSGGIDGGGDDATAAVASSESELEEQWRFAGFGELLDFFSTHLNSAERARIKLDNPIAVVERLVDTYSATVDERAAMLRKDAETLGNLNAQLEKYRQEMSDDFRYQVNRVEGVLHALRTRGQDFITSRITLTNIFEIANAEKFAASFQREVIRDSAAEIDTHVSELVDWLLEHNRRQCARSIDYLKHHTTASSHDMLGNGHFDTDRRALVSVCFASLFFASQFQFANNSLSLSLFARLAASCRWSSSNYRELR